MAAQDRALYDRALQLKLSEAGLTRYSYPRPHYQGSGKARVTNVDALYTLIPRVGMRNCSRCNTVYRIDDEGRPLTSSVCRYHFGRLYGSPVKRYRCCQQKSNAAPCKIASQHVTADIDLDNLTGFCHTQQSDNDEKSIYALDCEMIYTTEGMVVGAISVVNTDYQVVYETLVKPENLVDYNTEHSGLTATQFQDVTTNLQDVHSKLLSLFGSKTILVGHSLNHDLLRLKLIHDLVVDTAVIYPHPKGLPFRNSLRFLKRHILRSNESTSSALKCRDDAITTMKLLHRKC
ncbi:RNA exonuclease 1 homolog [Procambarus clarkii]|uniref:RNA exonuclease 1 homolog n=1 Tax=Procambarus clarkii TaxID=6728 RepID=UPI001E671600|nr:RNA exonuclease 1 homolog [Procambarus clarkii]XP_045595187.1 RNA exonuclease 1 homolog [Procambarus clarkii]